MALVVKNLPASARNIKKNIDTYICTYNQITLLFTDANTIL